MECYIHGIYIMAHSHWSQIFNNVFQNITGNPIKIRNFSNFNTIRNNVFSKTGIEGAYFDHFEISPDRMECPSYENYFADNILDGDYRSCGNLLESEIKSEPSYLAACCSSVDNPWKQMPCAPCEVGATIRQECEWPWERVDAQNNHSTGSNCFCSGDNVEMAQDCREVLGL
jgi:hypothetical protein